MAAITRARNATVRSAESAHLHANGRTPALSAVPDTPTGRQHRAIALTRLLTGLPLTQVLRLTRGDLKTRHATWRYRLPGLRNRWTPMPKIARLAIANALAAKGPRPCGRSIDDLADDELIFDVSRQAHMRALKRYARRVGPSGENPEPSLTTRQGRAVPLTPDSPERTLLERIDPTGLSNGTWPQRAAPRAHSSRTA